MTKAYDCALRLLTRREHGFEELIVKLQQKGFHQDDAKQVVRQCQDQGLQSDERFAEALLRSKMRQGYGPLRIRQELQAKQLNADLINRLLQSEEYDWHSLAGIVWDKKSINKDALDFSELQKMKRFMLYRGFSSDMIQAIIRDRNILIR